MLSGESLGVKGEVVLNAFLGKDWGAGGHIAQDRDLVGVGILLLCRRAQGNAGQGNSPGLALCFDNNSGLFQTLHVKMDSGGGLQPHG